MVGEGMEKKDDEQEEQPYEPAIKKDNEAFYKRGKH